MKLISIEMTEVSLTIAIRSKQINKALLKVVSY